MRTIVTLLCTLLFAVACVPPQAASGPAIQAAELCNQVYEHAANGNEDLVRRSNPTPEALNSYLTAANANRKAYREAHAVLLAAIGEMGTISPEQVNATAQEIINLIRASKGLPPLPTSPPADSRAPGGHP